MTPAQILWLLVLEVPVYTISAQIAEHMGALDVGGSITIHAFGAFYGLAASKVNTSPPFTYQHIHSFQIPTHHLIEYYSFNWVAT